MAPNKTAAYRLGFTITELVITVAIMTMLLGYAWEFYFSGRETMRHSVSQSQMQMESRIFLDHLGREISSAYRFHEVDRTSPTQKKFSFYSYQFSRTTLERILYNEATGQAISPQDQKFDVLKIEYIWNSADKKVQRIQTPGFLYFLKRPMQFTQGPSAQYEGTPNAPSTKDVLHNIQDFDVRPFEQKYKKDFNDGEDPFTLREIKDTGVNNASSATFIAVRLHNKIDESANKRDEELDLVAKFYSRTRLAEAAYPGYFSTMDIRPEF